ncbi:hypothetical protein Vau01_110450 [Virgisporangium aurantiacum]|uniref:Uncharacterized protein n=1 Tax=Virgisporangium aurantiacum TaxID=175570 RepID=A0A8J3ZG64_9ACTN|nr:hypothetical protein Vau01_110450 [Virgisporangium aurantiacum]
MLADEAAHAPGWPTPVTPVDTAVAATTVNPAPTAIDHGLEMFARHGLLSDGPAGRTRRIDPNLCRREAPRHDRK